MKNIMKFSALPLALALLLFSSCKKDTLDFASSTFFGVKALLESSNCDADCGDTAECEGKMTKIQGNLDESNINASDNQFYLIDKDDADFRLEVKVEEAISNEVFQKLNGQGGNLVKVDGIMEGYDAATNSNCKRQFTLNISDAAAVSVE